MVRVEPARFAITEVREQSEVQIVGPMKPSLPLVNHHRVHSQRFRKEPARHALLPTELLNVAPDDLLDLTSGLHMRSTQSILHQMTHMQGTLRNSLIAKDSDRHRSAFWIAERRNPRHKAGGYEGVVSRMSGIRKAELQRPWFSLWCGTNAGAAAHDLGRGIA